MSQANQPIKVQKSPKNESLHKQKLKIHYLEAKLKQLQMINGQQLLQIKGLHERIQIFNDQRQQNIIKLKQLNQMIAIKSEQNKQKFNKQIVFFACEIKAIINEQLIKKINSLQAIIQKLISISNKCRQNEEFDRQQRKLQNNFQIDKHFNQEIIPTNVIEQLKKLIDCSKSQILKHINDRLQSYSENIKKIMQNSIKRQDEFIKELPIELKNLKQACQKRQQFHKRKVSLLENQFKLEVKSCQQMASAQTTKITILENQLTNLQRIYNDQIQIPFQKIRENIDKEINKIKGDFMKIHKNEIMCDTVRDFTNTVKQYMGHKNQASNQEIAKQLSNIGNNLQNIHLQCMKTLGSISKSLEANSLLHSQYIEKMAKQKQKQICSKTKERENLQYKVMYSKQKQFIQSLELYNRKLEQTIKRAKYDDFKLLFQGWQKIRDHYSTNQKEVNVEMENFKEQITTLRSEQIQLKKIILLNSQQTMTIKSWIQQFKEVVPTITSFRDELFRSLQSQFKFKKQLNKQVETFNKIFVEQFDQLFQQYDNIPKLQSPINDSGYDRKYDELVTRNIDQYHLFTEKYVEFLNCKKINEARISRDLSAIIKLHQNYLAGRSEQKLNKKIEFDQKVIKSQLNSINTKIYNLHSSLRCKKAGQDSKQYKCEKQTKKFTEQRKVMNQFNKIKIIPILEQMKDIFHHKLNNLIQLKQLSESILEPKKILN